MSKNEHVYEVTGTLSEDCKSLQLDHAVAMKRVIMWLKGEKLEIKFSKLRNRRSDKQNRYIWGVVVVVIQAWFKESQGEDLTKDQVYTWLRVGLLGHKPVIKEILGEEVIVMEGKHFSAMNTKKFALAIDSIIKQMDEKGCFIPLPKDGNFITDYVKDE